MRARLVLAATVGAALAACAGGGSPLAGHDEPGAVGGKAGTAGTASAGAPLGGEAGASGAAAGAGNKAGAGGSSAGAAGATGGSSAGGAGAPFVEPDGAFELRLMSGIADAATVRLCLTAWSGAAVLPSPAFAPTEPLALGESALVTPPAAPVSVRPYVLSGEIAAVGAACADVVSAPPPTVRVTPLPALPATLWSAKRSVLLVAAGCAGGVSLTNASAACGVATSPTPTTASLVFAELSRAAVPEGAVGLQVLHASTAFGPVEVRVRQDGAPAATTLLAKLDPGAILTRPPLPVDPAALGLVPTTTHVEVADSSGGTVVDQTLGALLGASELDATALTAGHGFVFVIVGARPAAGGDAGSPARVVALRAPD